MIDMDVVDEGCAVARVLPIVRGKWTTVIVYLLSKGTLRFSELSRKMPMVTDANLTKELRSLEAHGLVHREVYPVVPPKVEYSLTDLGREFLPVVMAVAEFAEAYERATAQKKAAEHDGPSKL